MRVIRICTALELRRQENQRSIAHAVIVPCMFCQRIFRDLMLVVLMLAAQHAFGQKIDDARVPFLTTPQRLAIQEIEAAVRDRKADEAVERLLELSSRESTSLVPMGPPQQGFQLYFPLQQYLQQQLLLWRVTHPEILEAYKARVDAVAAKKLEEVRREPNWRSFQSLTIEYLASSVGSDALWCAAQFALSNAWWDEAAGKLTQLDASLSAWPEPAAAGGYSVGLTWTAVLSRIPDQKKLLATDLTDDGQPPRMLTLISPDARVAEAALQLLLVERARGNSDQRLKQFFSQRFAAVRVTLQGESLSFADAVVRLPPVTIAEPDPLSHRLSTHFSPTPIWSAELPDADFGQPLSPLASERQPCEPSLFPVKWRDKLLVATGASVRAFELSSGKPWPVANNSVPLWRFPGPTKELTSPLPLQSGNVVHQTIHVIGDLAVLRFGSPVTGWPLAIRISDRKNASSIAVLDLYREGRLLGGFPWHPQSPVWENLEVEGSPIVVDELVYVGLTRRDGVLTQSFVGCLDLSGRPRWLSPLLAESRQPASENGLRISHAQVSYDQGRLFYQASLGSVACLSCDGQVLWLTTYPRAELADRRYSRFRPAEARQLMEAIAVGDQVYVAPADCDRVFALSRNTGQPIWATAPGEAADALFFLGKVEGNIILSGDRLYWIDCLTGQIRAAFPAGTSQQVGGLRANPHGVGRAVLDRERVYFPTRETIFVFDATFPIGRVEPGMVQKIDLVNLGQHQLITGASHLTGGHLTIMGDRLILSSGSRIIAFPQR